MPVARDSAHVARYPLRAARVSLLRVTQCSLLERCDVCSRSPKLAPCAKPSGGSCCRRLSFW